MDFSETEYVASVERWRAEREARLRAEDGWLSLAGLFWLEPGQNRVGSDPSSPVRLPGGPGELGVLELLEEGVRFTAHPGVGVSLNGAPVQEAWLEADLSGHADTLALGSVKFYVIRRGERWGVRVIDNASPARREFRGLSWFPPDPRLRVRARLVPHPEPVTIPVVNVLGMVSESPSPGYAVFELEGREYRLLAESSDPERYLFFNFRDATSGRSTYPAGRYLSTEGVREGEFVLDFNKAINPPCAFTPYATCPLAPLANRLGVAVEAGEKHHHSPRG